MRGSWTPRAKILLQALAQHGCMDADNVVASGVVIGGAAEHLVSHLLLVDFAGVVVQDAVAQVSEEVPQPCRPVHVAAGSDPLDQQSSCIRDLDAITRRHTLHRRLVTIITPLFTVKT